MTLWKGISAAVFASAWLVGCAGQEALRSATRNLPIRGFIGAKSNPAPAGNTSGMIRLAQRVVEDTFREAPAKPANMAGSAAAGRTKTVALPQEMIAQDDRNPPANSAFALTEEDKAIRYIDWKSLETGAPAAGNVLAPR